MWTVTVCFMAICFLVQVKASPDISLEDLLERLVTLEDWKREAENEVSALRETVARQGENIKNLETDLAITQTDLAAALQSSKQDMEEEILEHDIETVDDGVSNGHISDTRIRDLEKSVPVKPSKLNKRAIAGGVAFSAFLDHGVDPGSRQTIKFNQIITNDGNAYNSYTGVFTCPVAGMYLFAFHLAERSETSGMRQLWTELRVNNKPLVGAVAQTDNTYGDDQGGNTVVVFYIP